MKVEPEYVLVAAFFGLLWWTGRTIGKAVTEDVGEAVDASRMSLTDFFAWLSGLDAQQRRILEDSDYAARYLALE